MRRNGSLAPADLLITIGSVRPGFAEGLAIRKNQENEGHEDRSSSSRIRSHLGRDRDVRQPAAPRPRAPSRSDDPRRERGAIVDPERHDGPDDQRRKRDDELPEIPTRPPTSAPGLDPRVPAGSFHRAPRADAGSSDLGRRLPDRRDDAHHDPGPIPRHPAGSASGQPAGRIGDDDADRPPGVAPRGSLLLEARPPRLVRIERRPERSDGRLRAAAADRRDRPERTLARRRSAGRRRTIGRRTDPVHGKAPRVEGALRAVPRPDRTLWRRAAGRHGQRRGGDLEAPRAIARPGTGPRPAPRGNPSDGVARPPPARVRGRRPELHGKLPLLPDRSDGPRQADRREQRARRHGHGLGRRVGVAGPSRRSPRARRRVAADYLRRNARSSTRGGGRATGPGSIFPRSDVQRDAAILRASARGIVEAEGVGLRRSIRPHAPGQNAHWASGASEGFTDFRGCARPLGPFARLDHNSRYSANERSTEYRSTATCRAPSRSRWSWPSLEANSSSRSLAASGERTRNPLTPSTTASSDPGMLVVRIGMPIARASSHASGGAAVDRAS